MSCDWKTAYKKNRVKIVGGLANPDAVAGLLFQSEIFSDEMHETVRQIDENEQKTRKILDLLNYRGKNGLAALHQAFLDTSNKELAKGLAPYVLAVEEGDNKTEPKEWPPSVKQVEVMLNDPVIKIKDTKSPLFIHEYGQEYVYTIQSELRGKVFIINNVNFKGPMQDRPASIKDAENLTKLFEELHFTVLRKDDLTSQEGCGSFQILQCNPPIKSNLRVIHVAKKSVLTITLNASNQSISFGKDKEFVP